MALVDSKLIVALDFANAKQAFALAEQLNPQVAKLKIGKELFTREGPALVETLQSQGFDIFLDLKFHDIPNTVAKACAAAAELGVWMVNVHASGGSRMMAAAKKAVDDVGSGTHLIAVTVLTSMTEQDLQETGISVPIAEHVNRLAGLAFNSGMDGLVCSGFEAQGLRDAFGSKPLLVTPGIRLAGDAAGDQRRVMTPEKAMASGASYLVMGRSITGASDPIETCKAIGEALIL